MPRYIDANALMSARNAQIIDLELNKRLCEQTQNAIERMRCSTSALYNSMTNAYGMAGLCNPLTYNMANYYKIPQASAPVWKDCGEFWIVERVKRGPLKLLEIEWKNQNKQCRKLES